MDKNIEYKTSFDRFGEDLCCLLISYLPFEDKVKFLCISKLLNRTIKIRQYTLNIHYYSGYDSISNLIMNNGSICTDKLEFLLKNFPNLNSIYFESFIMINNKVFELLTYCGQIKFISFNLSAISKYLMIFYGKNFCQNLKRIEFKEFSLASADKHSFFINKCSNIEAITCDSRYIDLLPTKTLEEMKILFNIRENVDYFIKIHPKIYHLSTLKYLSYHANHTIQLPLIPTNIKELHMTGFWLDSGYFENLSICFPNLEALNLMCRIDSKIENNLELIFLSISKLKFLKRICLCLWFIREPLRSEIIFPILTNCNQLKYIELLFHLEFDNKLVVKLKWMAKISKQQFIIFKCIGNRTETHKLADNLLVKFI